MSSKRPKYNDEDLAQLDMAVKEITTRIIPITYSGDYSTNQCMAAHINMMQRLLEQYVIKGDRKVVVLALKELQKWVESLIDQSEATFPDIRREIETAGR